MSLHFDVTAENRNFIQTMREIEKSVKQTTDKIEKSGYDIEAFFERLKRGAIGLLGAFSAKGFVSEVIKVRGEFQKLDVAFETMLGNSEKAKALMSELIHTAAITPFGVTDVTNGAKQLLAYGTAADEVNDVLMRLGDIAAGLSLPLNDLVFLYGTTMVQGRMFTQDLRQFQGRGIPIVDELAKQFGVAKSKVSELVTEGKVGAQEFQQAIMSMSDAGGKFGGLMEKQSKTIAGQISNIEDAIEQMFNQIGQSNEGIISDTIGLVSKLVDNWETVGKVLLTVASAYGAYKAAVIAVAAAHKMSAIWGEVQAFLSLAKSVTSAKDAMLLLNMATAANPVGLILGVVGAAAASYALFSKNTDKATTMTEKFGASAATVISKLDTLNKILQGTSANSELHTKVMGELNGVLQEYGFEALNESASIAEVNRKREQAISLIKEEAIERQRANALEQGQQDYANALKSAKEQLLSDLSNATTGRTIFGLDFSTANEEIRENASAISSIIGNLVESNISEIAGKTGKEYEEGVKKIYEQISERMKAIGLSETTISSVWKDGGFLMVEDLLGKYINKVKDAEEEHNRFTDSIEKSAKAEKDAAEGAMTFSEKVEATSKRLAGAEDDVHGLYKRIKDLMSQYSENTIGFTIKFSKDVPEWMNSKELPELQKLAARFTALGNKATDAGLTIGDTHWTKQELLQRGADYAQTAENKQLAIDKKKKEEESKTEAEKKKEAREAERKAQDARRQAKAMDAAGAKIADLIRKQGEERLRIEQDYEYERWQSRIDIMEDGAKKVLAQQSLNFEKEKTELKRRLDDELETELNRQIALFDAEQDLKAASDKKYGKRSFRDSDIDNSKMDEIKARYKKLENDLTQSQANAEAKRLKVATDSMNDYLREYGSYEEKRKAIQAQYEAKINGSANMGERMTNEAQMRKDLAELDYNEWLNTGDIALAFGDISGLSKKTISNLIADMEKYRDKVISTFDPSNIAKYEEALAALRKKEVADTFSAFGSMVPEYFTKRLEIQKQINDQAKIGLELTQKANELNLRIDSQRGMVKIAAKSAGYELSDEDIADPKKMQQLADKIQPVAVHGKNFAASLHSALVELLKLNGEAAELEKTTKSWDGNFAHLKESLDKLEGEEKILGICDAVSKASDMVGNLANQAAEMADAMGAEGLGEALGYVGEAMNSVGNIASGFAQGELIGGIAAAASELMNWATKLFMAGDAKHQKNIEKLQAKIDALQKSYDKLGKATEKAFSTDASNLIQQQDTLLKQQQVLIRQQMAEEEAKKKTDNEKIQEYKDRLEEIDEILAENKDKAKEALVGEDMMSAIEQFASAYAEAFESGSDAAKASAKVVKSILTSALNELMKKNLQPTVESFYNALAKAMEDGVVTDSELRALDALKAQLDSIANSQQEQYDKIANRYKDLDELKEELTDLSFDSVRDNFKSLLADMESSTADFAESFKDMLRNAMFESLMNNKYDKMLKEWYDEFAEAMNDQSLTDAERDALRQEYDSIVQQGLTDREIVNDIIGGGSYSQSVSTGGWDAMGQDQADELNGRFTALTELQVISNDLQQTQNTLAAQILATLQGMGALSGGDGGTDPTLLAIKDMMFLSTGYLEDIAKYSRRIYNLEECVKEVTNTLKERL